VALSLKVVSNYYDSEKNQSDKYVMLCYVPVQNRTWITHKPVFM